MHDYLCELFALSEDFLTYTFDEEGQEEASPIANYHNNCIQSTMLLAVLL